MGYRIVIILFAATCCSVQSQLCVSSSLPAFPNVPQVISSPVIATTVVDNSVSNALANALQLFIVSDLIQSRLGTNCAPNGFVNGLGAVETLTPVYPAVDVISPCAPVEIVSPVLETVTPNIYGGLTENFTPILGGYPETIYPNSYVTETFIPNCYNGWTETLTPVCTDVVTPNLLSPNIFGGVNEIISPQPCGCGTNYFGGLQEMVSPLGPNYFERLPEVSPFISGPCGPNYFTPEVMPSFLPNYYGAVPEIVSPNPFRPGFSEVISPAFAPNYFGGLPEVITTMPYSPCGEIITPNPFGAPFPNEVISQIGPYGPISAEVVIPPSIPAQLTCNIGYSNSMPCVNFNVEPLPYESYGCFNNIPNFYFQ